MTSILRAVIQGLETTYENNSVGGMASTFQLLEIAHTYYCLKDDAVKNDLTPMSERNSPLGGSRESLASIDPNISNINTSSLSSNIQLPLKQTVVTSPTANLVMQLGE